MGAGRGRRVLIPAVCLLRASQQMQQRPPHGRRYLCQLDKLVAAIQEDLLAPPTPPEREQLVRLLTRLLDHHTRAGPQHTGDHHV
jgi:hypothetical protein